MRDVGLKVRVVEVRYGLKDLRLRLPFRFGVATLTEAPMLRLGLVVEDAEGRRAAGRAADLLPALWFDKSPDKPIELKIDDQIEMAAAAARISLDFGKKPVTPFRLSLETLAELKREAAARGINALTAQFGASFAERAMIDAVCRLAARPFEGALRTNLFAVEPEAIHPELKGLDLERVLPEAPLREMWVRHTIGLGDALTPADLPKGDRLDDGLPETLEEELATRGLRYFKIKIGADRAWNFARLTGIARILRQRCGTTFRVTLDGNEQVQNLGDLEWLLDRLGNDPDGRVLRRSILFIEQPLPRERALDPEIAPALAQVNRRCPVIVDESDDAPDTLALARRRGYAGVSAKNCKGVFKAALHRALVTVWNERDAGLGRWLVSAEDLSTLPVIPLQEDLATIAALGFEHAERNGHHYFRGLDHLSPRERQSALESHADLYEVREGLAQVRIREGRLRLGSIQCPGFGYASQADDAGFVDVETWRSAREGRSASGAG